MWDLNSGSLPLESESYLVYYKPESIILTFVLGGFPRAEVEAERGSHILKEEREKSMSEILRHGQNSYLSSYIFQICMT